MLLKTDGTGTPQWARTYGSDGSTELEEARSFRLSDDGGYIVVGNSGGSVFEPGDLMQNPVDILVFKVDDLGEELWSQTVTAARFTIAYGSSMNSDGSFAVAGSSGEHTPGDRGALLIKMDPDGGELWRRTFLVGSALSAKDVVSTTDGGYAIAGFLEHASRSPRRWDLYIAKLDEEGNREWDFQGSDRLEIARDRFGESIVQTNDGGYAVTGTAYDENTSNLFVAKFDSDGGLLWTSTAPGPLRTAGYALIEDTDGSLVAAGHAYSYAIFDSCQRFYGARFDENGNLEWSGRFGGRATESAYAITQNADGNFVLTGGRAPLDSTDLSRIHLVTTSAGR